MVSRVLLLGLSVISVALAGCSGGDDNGPSPAELCDGMYADDVCTPHTEPSIILTGLSGSLEAYLNHEYTWALDNGTRGMPGEPVHSMDSRIIANTEATIPTNVTEPDGFGVEIAQEEHQNLPGNFTGEFSWSQSGDVLNLWGYMRIEGVHTWNSLGQVTIIDVQPTSSVAAITLTAGPPPSTDKAQAQFTIGGGFTFTNSLPVTTVMSYTISFDCTNGVQVSDLIVDAGATSSVVSLLAPTNCAWTANSVASATGVDPLAVGGTIIAGAP